VEEPQRIQEQRLVLDKRCHQYLVITVVVQFRGNLVIASTEQEFHDKKVLFPFMAHLEFADGMLAHPYCSLLVCLRWYQGVVDPYDKWGYYRSSIVAMPQPGCWSFEGFPSSVVLIVGEFVGQRVDNIPRLAVVDNWEPFYYKLPSYFLEPPDGKVGVSVYM
jgi:hypothetical protein